MEKETKGQKDVCMACECPCEVHTVHTHRGKPGKICVSCGEKCEEGKKCEKCVGCK